MHMRPWIPTGRAPLEHALLCYYAGLGDYAAFAEVYGPLLGPGALARLRDSLIRQALAGTGWQERDLVC